MSRLKQLEAVILVLLAASMFVGGTADARGKQKKNAQPNIVVIMGKGHPRSAGTRAKVLRMVRESNVVPLMEAIAKLSYLQAKFLEDMVPDMQHRGRLKPGAIADITIFDPATVTDNSAWDKGKNSLPSTGIPYVIVNGTVVVKDSKVLKDVFPGRPIRNAVQN